MTLEVIVGSQNVTELLDGPPVIDDQLQAACRKLELYVRITDDLSNAVGQIVELWYGGKRWYYGHLIKRALKSNGIARYTALDPLFYMNRNPDDYYLKNMTANQGIRYMAEKLEIPIGTLANTGAVFKALYYHNAMPDGIAVDLLARTFKARSVKYWYRFNPGTDDFGLTVFERITPTNIWAFQVGVNLEASDYAESLEEVATIVRLVNRETGKTVERINDDTREKYGPLTHFQETDKDSQETMEREARDLLADVSKIKAEITASGINPNQAMPQLYSGDVVYVEEKHTQLLGAYHIKNVRQTFESSRLVKLGMDLQEAPDVAKIQYEGATDGPQ